MACDLGVLGSGTHCVGSCYSMDHAVLGVVLVATGGAERPMLL
jgi:hypothetical protein